MSGAPMTTPRQPQRVERDDNMKMNAHRAQELIVPLKNGKSNGISPEWTKRMIEALEYVIENESAQKSVDMDIVRQFPVKDLKIIEPKKPRWKGRFLTHD